MLLSHLFYSHRHPNRYINAVLLKFGSIYRDRFYHRYLKVRNFFIPMGGGVLSSSSFLSVSDFPSSGLET